MKSYTDLEQSKKLAEFLPLESADMHYMHTHIDIISLGKPYKETDVPAWSLAALMDVLERGALFNTPKGWACQTYVEYEAITGNFHSNPVDACYEMILKLHEQKLL